MRAFLLAAVLVATALALSACGGSGPTSGFTGFTAQTGTAPQTSTGPKLPAPGQFLSVDAAARRVTITLIAGYDGTNNGFNFDGYSRELLWTVHVVCENRGSLRHSCAVVSGAASSEPAFPGAETPQPTIGLDQGHTAQFTFRAAKAGSYRFACLVPGHEDARMWDPLKVASGGKPSVASLLAQ
jgi:hypothetical protein